MSEKKPKPDIAFWTGVILGASLTVMFVLDTIAIIEQSWRLGIGATGGWLAFVVLTAVVGAVLRHAVERAHEPERQRRAEALDRALADDRPFVYCQKPVYKGYGNPEPCALEAEHFGHCQP